MHSNESYKRNFHYQSNVCQQMKLINREVNTNYRDENKFFHGFIPLWALTLFSIAGIFCILFIAGLICYLAGCGRSRHDRTVNIHSLIVEQPLLEENNQLQIRSTISDKSKDTSF
jgi:hypothetical protein